MKKIRNIIIVIVLLPVLVAFMPFFVIVCIPAACIHQLRANLALRAFRHRNNGTVYLICTSKRGWHDFLKNNLIPVLPDNFRVVWHKQGCVQGRDGKLPPLFKHLATSHIFSISKPYLVVVTPKALVPKSINRAFTGLKSKAARSTEVQAACAKQILEIEQELRATASKLSSRSRVSA
jgi:hypothetical protein